MRKYKTSLTEIFYGDCLEILKQIPDMSVQMCVTSPPYWNLRDYGCEGQIGMEKTPEEYVAKLVKIFRQIKRVLKNDGTLWLNLGDTYCGGGRGKSNIKHKGSENMPRSVVPASLKPKDLIGIPWRAAFALQADGWWLRNDIIWNKPNCMPESVKDRCTVSHEYIFLLSKCQKYYFDNEAILEKATGYDGRKDTLMKGSNKYKNNISSLHNIQSFAAYGHERWPQKIRGMATKDDSGIYPKGNEQHHGKNIVSSARMGTNIKNHSGYFSADGSPLYTEKDGIPARNKRTVWTIPTKPYNNAHFAVYPPELIAPCILAGSRKGDVVIDPFLGSGTTAEVAEKFGRKCIGIEINIEYKNLQKRRLSQPYLNL